jgi:Aspartyl protease
MNLNRNNDIRDVNQKVENAMNTIASKPIATVCASNVPLFRANLVRCIVNECVSLFGLVDSGATCTAISLATFLRLRANGQCNNMYKVQDLKLAAVNGDELKIFGEVYLRVQVGNTLLRTRALVITDLQHALILGNDVMRKYKFIISYDDETLLIKKKTNLVTVQPTKISPKSTILKGSLHQKIICYNIDSICLFSLENDVGNVFVANYAPN